LSLLRYNLTYHHDSARLFARIVNQPWAVFLDSGQMLDAASGQPGSQYGRYDILVADPFITFVSDELQTQVYERGQTSISADDPFELLKQALRPYVSAQSDLPFTGGAIGYFGYDLARRLEKLASIASNSDAIPPMQVGIYDWAVVIDHRHKTSCLVSNGFDANTRENWDALCALFGAPINDDEAGLEQFAVIPPVQANMDKHTYARAFDAIQDYIHEGDCYQVNLAQRFSAKAHGNGWQAYQKLREISPAPFMAYMNLGRMQVLSGSPERFLQLVDGHVETRPIKGTRPRADDALLDAQYAADLQSSIKDKAENLMIVDLLRNDIGKNCETGSVKADKLFQLQSFANVHHLVSIVTGKLQAAKTAIDLLRGCFPGGSITGAPKLRAMEIIEELEPHRRGVYCGAIGYIGFDGNMDTNIAIRTAVYIQDENGIGEISFYAGGGIVADSELEKEYTETLDKASSMLKVMQFFSK
jgi:para-aminobenzoate synthetase component 1